MDRMLRIQGKICYGTSLVTLGFSLWHFVGWVGTGNQVEYEKAVVLGVLAIGVFVVGWVVHKAVEEDDDEGGSGRSMGPSVDF
jgi:hypothetical protein